MIPIQCTPTQAARWADFLLESANLRGYRNLDRVSPSKRRECLEMYQKAESIRNNLNDVEASV